MTNHAHYYNQNGGSKHRHLSKIFSSVLEASNYSLFISNGDGLARKKLEMRPKTCVVNGVNGVSHQKLMVHEPEDGLPIDLSGGGKRSESYENSSEGDGENGNNDDDEMDNDQPLNLSMNGHHLNGVARATKPNSPELIQKRVRLEEMVSYIRKCSVGESPKFCSGYSHANGSDADSEGGDAEEEPTPAVIKHANGNRRKRSVPYRGGVIEVTYRAGNGDAIHQRSYPVLSEHLRRKSSPCHNGMDDDIDDVDEDEGRANSDVNSDDADDDVKSSRRMRSSGSGSSSNSNSNVEAPIVPHSHWSTYAYYANLFQELQNSLPPSAQGLLMTTAAAGLSEPIMANGESVQSSQDGQQPGQHSQGQGHLLENGMANGNGNAANALLRKRAPRALTGKHVKHGTGASPATLLTLRQKIEQKMNQQQPEAVAKVTKCNSNGSSSNGNGRRALLKRPNKRK